MFLNDPRHARAIPKYREMVRDGTLAAVCMPLLRMEFWNVFRRIAQDNTGPQLVAMVRDARESLTGQAGLFTDTVPRSVADRRRYAVRAADELLELWLAPLRIARIRLTYWLLEDARDNIAAWGLRSHDAIWLSVAETLAEETRAPAALLTGDGDFARVDGLEVWGLVD